MSKNTDEDLLQLFQNIQHNTESAAGKVDIARTTVTLEYLTSLDRLDNKSSCVLLQQNLKKHSSLITGENPNDTKIKDILSKQPSQYRNRYSTLDKLDLNSFITKLNCSDSSTCPNSENRSETHFQNFLDTFNEKRHKKPVAENKRTIAKSFAPQSCNSRERRFVRQPVETVRLDDKKIEERCEKEAKLENKFGFKTAREELGIQHSKIGSSASNNVGNNIGGQKRKLGPRRGVGNKFVSPLLSNTDSNGESSKSQEWVDEMVDERLKNIEPRMVELIKSEIMDCGPPIEWNDIAGLEFAKNAIQEAVVWPMLRPDIFTGLRRPPKGILLFGPPGTGKTLIGKCVASQSKSTFFSISASSLTSKWVGDGEKMVRALFAVARCHQPAVIFIDEIDSLLSQRSDTEHESSRRIKTEFLVQLDGATTDSDERLLVIGATNRPQELDEAARRRFVKRLYIPLPELEARYQLVKRLMSDERNNLSDADLTEVAKLSEGYSGADMRNLCSDASMGPIRCIGMTQIQSIQSAEVRPVNMEDFRKALYRVRSSVSPNDLNQYILWDKTYGSGSFC